MNYEDIYLQNPWWNNREDINKDYNISKLSKSIFKYTPEFISNIDFEKKGIYTLRGPRQVGKTTSLKILIDKLLKSGIEPSSILYLTLDNVKDKEELTEILKRWILLSKRKNIDLFIFLDEITFIKNWQESIKYLVDIDIARDSFIFLSGSSAYDLKRSSERLPGRRGKGKNLIQLPLTYKEFITNSNYSNIPNFSLNELFELDKEEIESLNFQLIKYHNEFEIYKSSGGFPLVINDFLQNNVISNETIRIYEDFILGDIERFSKSRLTLIELLKKIPQIIGQRFSWNSLNNSINTVEAANTIESYFQMLGMNFIFSTLFFYDFSKKRIKPKKQKKIYPLDTIITRVIENISGIKINEGNKIESLVLQNILKFSTDNTEGLNLYYGPYYWYSSKGNEIDFLVEYNKSIIPIEVKYQNKINKSDYTTMKRVFKKGIVLTKNKIFKDENIIGMPIYLFLLLI